MKQSTKTLLLWLVLIAVFTAIYQLGDDPSSQPPRTGPLAYWHVAVLGAVGVGVVGLLIHRGRKWVPAGQANNEGLSLLNSGRFSQALAKFDEAYRLSPQTAFRFNATVAQLRLWQPEKALPALEALLEGTPDATVQTLALDNVLWARALLGDGPGHARALTQAQAHRAALAEKGVPPQDAGLEQLSLAILACRGGRWDDARAHLLRPEIAGLASVPRTLSDVLLAWTAEQLTGERRPIHRVNLLGEAGPDRLAALWPELLAFVERSPSV
jgi:tetratricopeptide (TPR) repeat protein